MTEKEKGMQAVVDAQEALIKELTKELRHEKRERLRMKLHLSVLAGSPGSETAEQIRKKHQDKDLFSETLLHCN